MGLEYDKSLEIRSKCQNITDQELWSGIGDGIDRLSKHNI